MNDQTPTEDARGWVGRRVGKYQIERMLGRGGMGVVYLASDTTLPRKVAIKAVRDERSSDPQLRRRLADETRNTCRVQHSFVAKVHEVIEHEGEPLLVMEYVPGSTLGASFSDEPASDELVERYAREIGEALQAIHDAGLVHRDLTPGNVMIADDGHVKVMDFGIAARRAPVDKTAPSSLLAETQTSTGRTFGTIPYMSPEQVRGRSVDARSDLFSLGVILARLITGGHPFQRESQPEMILAIDSAPPYEHDRRRDELLERSRYGPIVKVLLEKEPSGRFSGAAELLEALSEVERGQTVTAPRPRPAAPGGSSWLLTSISAIVAVFVVGAALLWFLDQGKRTPVELPTPMLVSTDPVATDAYDSAKVFYRDIRLSRALREVDRALKSDPGYLEASLLRARTLFRMKRDDPARREIEKLESALSALDLPEGDEFRLRVRALRHEVFLEKDEAATVYDELASRYPRKLELQLEAARALHGDGKYDRALEVAEAAADLNPDDFRPLLQQARTWMMQDEPARAEELFADAERVVTQSGAPSGLGEISLARGRLAFQTGAYEEAIQHYRQALKVFDEEQLPERAISAMRSVAEVHIKNWNFDDAEKALDEMARMSLRFPAEHLRVGALATLASGLLRESRVERSVELFEQSTELARTLGDTERECIGVAMLISAYTYLGRTESAHESATEARRLTERHSYLGRYTPTIRKFSADLRIFEGRFDEARRELDVLEEPCRAREGGCVSEGGLSIAQARAKLELNAGAASEAVTAATRGVDIAEKLGLEERLGYTLTIRSRAYALSGSLREAEEDLERAEPLLREARQPIFLESLRLARATLAYRRGELEEALSIARGGDPKPLPESAALLWVGFSAARQLGGDEFPADSILAYPWLPRYVRDAIEAGRTVEVASSSTGRRSPS